jgi:hypothetical protein
MKTGTLLKEDACFFIQNSKSLHRNKNYFGGLTEIPFHMVLRKLEISLLG